MDNYLDKLYISIFQELQGPQMIEWFPTYLCNSKCTYCGGYDREAIAGFGQILPYGKIIDFVRLSAGGGTSVWNIGGRGGEPLLYLKLIDILEEIKRYNMQGILITNGLLLDEGFISRLVKSEWDTLRISLDSHIPGIHDRIRGVNGNFDKIDKSLDLFKKIKQENNSSYPNIVCCPVLTKRNYSHIAEFIEYCIEKGVSEIQFMPLTNVHEKAEKLMLSDGEKRELVGLLEKKSCEGRIKHNIGFIISLYRGSGRGEDQELNSKTGLVSKLYCIHLWKTLVISEDGYLSPCSLIKEKLFKIQDSFLTVWDCHEMNELRKKILKGELINPACKDCCGPLRQETFNFNNTYLKAMNKCLY